MTLLSSVSGTVRAAWRRLTTWRVVREVERISSQRGPIAPGTIEAVVFFSDPPVNLYQVQQWYEPLRRLAEIHPLAVVARSPRSARQLLDECPLPVLFSPRVSHLEEWLATQPVLAFLYVNQTARNFTALRFTEPAHLFLNHGESDKAYMVSNQVKAYDVVFVAGAAAERRIHAGVFDAHRANVVQIGRPQIDVQHVGPSLPRDGRTTVLYAPTWEGDRPSNSYSSVISHGDTLVRSLLATGRHRVIYRPHPRTGAMAAEFGAASQHIASLIAAANRADSTAGHLVDADGPFGWQLAAADVCVTDISAVAYDWAATRKPLVLTRPAATGAVLDVSGIAGAVPLIAAGDVAGTVAVLDSLVDDGPSEEYLAKVFDHFGDTTPGASMQRFLDAAHDAIEARRVQRAARETRAQAS